MAVNWYWKHKVGEVLFVEQDKKIHWKLELFGGNVMCAFIYRYKQKNTITNKYEKFYRFFVWLNDLKHAERVFKDDKDILKNLPYGNHKLTKVKLCISSKNYKQSNKEMLAFAKILVTNGYKVELY